MYHSAVGVTSFLYIRQVTYQLRADVKKMVFLGDTHHKVDEPHYFWG